MNKDKFIIIPVIVLLMVAGFYFFSWQSGLLGRLLAPESSSHTQIVTQQQLSGKNEEGQKAKCPMQTNIILDGYFQKAEGEFIYFRPQKQKGVVEKIQLTPSTIFLELTFSSQMKEIARKEISLADFKDGDPVSVIALYQEDRPSEKRAMVIRRMIVRPD